MSVIERLRIMNDKAAATRISSAFLHSPTPAPGPSSSLIEERGSGALSSNSVGGIATGIVGKLTVRGDNPISLRSPNSVQITQFGPKFF